MLALVPQIISLLVAIVYGRSKVHGIYTEPSRTIEVSASYSLREVLRRSLHLAIHALSRIVPRYIVATALVVIFTVLNVTTYLSNVVTPLPHTLGFSYHFVIVVCTGIISPVTAVFLVGEFVRSSFLSCREALLVLVLTRFLFIVLSDYPRHVVPLYLSLYPPKLVVKLVAISLSISITSLPLQLFLVYLLT
ncbi:MAG: hypothetical protein DRJ40_05025 [Thermoprotei archaeon]|nr:MAG: hypothetical protein DRJ40_04500 [Thermoprotei archaeon]RLE56761.1 MAG: hypothetical protein DRJ40_05025 [Thermoprotei archaeon]